MAEGGYVGQTSTTFPLTEPLATPLSVMLPFDQTSPVTVVVELPVKVSEFPEPLQFPGLRVWIAAPFVPGLRASAVAVAPTSIDDPNPSTCINVIATRCVAVAVKVTPAIE
jgi:hypothetical protein